MRDLGSDLERRGHARRRRTLACELLLADQSHPATIVELSEGGALVESEAPAWPGALVRVRLPDADRYALVLRERQHPHRLRGLVPSGFALRWVVGTVQ